MLKSNNSNLLFFNGTCIKKLSVSEMPAWTFHPLCYIIFAAYMFESRHAASSGATLDSQGQQTPMDLWKISRKLGIIVSYCFLKAKTLACNRKDPVPIFSWLHPCSFRYLPFSVLHVAAVSNSTQLATVSSHFFSKENKAKSGAPKLAWCFFSGKPGIIERHTTSWEAYSSTEHVLILQVWSIFNSIESRT